MSTDTHTAWDFTSTELPFRDQLYKTALRLTRSPHEADDLLQETYLKAFRAYEQFEEGSNLKAWLFKIMKNSFINRYRKIKRQPQQLELSEYLDGSEGSMINGGIADGPDHEQVLVDAEMHHEVKDALLELPHAYRMAVLLVDLQGFSYDDAAELLCVPKGTVMSRLYRGRKKLERTLLDFGRKYNYLDRPPARRRDTGVDLTRIFNS